MALSSSSESPSVSLSNDVASKTIADDDVDGSQSDVHAFDVADEVEPTLLQQGERLTSNLMSLVVFRSVWTTVQWSGWICRGSSA